MSSVLSSRGGLPWEDESVSRRLIKFHNTSLRNHLKIEAYHFHTILMQIENSEASVTKIKSEWNDIVKQNKLMQLQPCCSHIDKISFTDIRGFIYVLNKVPN